MNRICWLLLCLIAGSGPLTAACSSKFDSCEARRTCPQTSDAGNAGAAGDDSSGDAGTEQGGAAGESGSSGDFPSLFDDCATKGEVSCVAHASAQRLACDGKIWQAGTTCAAGELCDSRDGRCAVTVSECASAQPGGVVCREDTPLTCGADLVSASEGESCAGLCRLGLCEAPVCGDEKVEEGEDCDDAEATASGACVKCWTARCGDDALYEGHEQCDDGNEKPGDGCSATCRAEPVALALGDAITCALSSTGLVKCWGYNRYGQLGLGDVEGRGGTPTTRPSKLPAIDLGQGRTAASISVRGTSVCALLDNSEVKCWGNNTSGQLGTDDRNHRGDQPGEMGDDLKSIRLEAGVKAVRVSAGATHSCAVLQGGGVKCWGFGLWGQLGQGSSDNALSPERLPQIKFSRPVTEVSASRYTGFGTGGPFGAATCALLDDGTIRCWGLNVPRSSASDLDSNMSVGNLAAEMSALPVLKPGNSSRAKSIIPGLTFASLSDEGSLRLWGEGEQLGQPDFGFSRYPTPDELATQAAVDFGNKKVLSVDVGDRHACAVLQDGVLKCWGLGNNGALGLGSNVDTTAAPKDIPPVELYGHGAQRVATGQAHTCAILDDGTVRCWGHNGSGELGLGDTVTRGDAGGKLSADTTVDLSF